jgi:hypothetical protein
MRPLVRRRWRPPPTDPRLLPPTASLMAVVAAAEAEPATMFQIPLASSLAWAPSTALETPAVNMATPTPMPTLIAVWPNAAPFWSAMPAFSTPSAVAVTPVPRDRPLPRVRPCTASCRSFEGQHPPRTWPLLREEKAQQLGYAPSEHPLKPWPMRPHQEIDALSFRDIRFDFNSPLASAALITGNHISPRVTTEPTRVIRHDAPNGPGDLTTRPPDAGRSSGMERCALDISPSRRSAACVTRVPPRYGRLPRESGTAESATAPYSLSATAG